MPGLAEVVKILFGVIQMSTINGAELRKETDDLGTVEAGKLADIVVVGGDPMDDESVLGNVEHVFVNGE